MNKKIVLADGSEASAKRIYRVMRLLEDFLTGNDTSQSIGAKVLIEFCTGEIDEIHSSFRNFLGRFEIDRSGNVPADVKAIIATYAYIGYVRAPKPRIRKYPIPKE